MKIEKTGQYFIDFVQRTDVVIHRCAIGKRNASYHVTYSTAETKPGGSIVAHRRQNDKVSHSRELS